MIRRTLYDIDENTLKALVSANSIRETVIVRHGEGYALRFKFGSEDVFLRSQREKIRVFKSLDTMTKLLRRLGLTIITLDLN